LKKLQILITCAALAFAVGCGKKKDDKGGDKGGGGAKPAPTEPAAPAAPAVTVSPQMTAFMSDLKGKSADVEAALKTHGVEGLDTKDMEMYDLNSPKVVASEGDCATMEAKSGMTVRTYVLCWKDGKIASIEDKGMK
jgi:hypothetical protein